MLHKSLVAVFSLSKKQNGRNPTMTIKLCLFSAFFLGTSGAQAIAADDLVEHCSSAFSESVCRPNPTTVQQHLEIGAVTSGRGNGKMLGKRRTLRLQGTSITDRCTTQFFCIPSHSFMKI